MDSTSDDESLVVSLTCKRTRLDVICLIVSGGELAFC